MADSEGSPSENNDAQNTGPQNTEAQRVEAEIAEKLISETPPDGGGFRGLILILASIVLGVLLGLFYGESMWLASGGPEKALERLGKTIEQKQSDIEKLRAEADAAEQANQPELRDRRRKDVERLEAHIPVIEQRIAETERMAAQAKVDRETGKYWLAGTTWIFSEFFGDLFLQVLKLLVIPLVVTSMICGITSLGDIRKVGRVGMATLIYYFVTGSIAVLIGILLVVAIEPGNRADDTFAYRTEAVEAKQDVTVLETLLNVFRGREGDDGSGMFPSNIFQAASTTNVLALIVFAIVFGGALTTLGDEGLLVIRFFNAANAAVMKMVHLVMLFAPIGIFGLVASSIAKNGGGAGFLEQLQAIGFYVMTVVIGLLLHSLLLASLLPLLARRNPVTYTFNLAKAILTSMSTASSAATLPITMECVIEENNVSRRAGSFVLPLGATINMDGTALYEAVAVIFIAQTLGIDLSMGELAIIFLTASLAAVGAAGIPEAGLVTMVIVLQAVGLPLSGIGTILAIDWFLDRLRTSVNVYGDAVGAAVIDKIVIEKGG